MRTFVEYINTFLKLKAEASLYPSWVRTPDDEDLYIREFYHSEGIQLDKDCGNTHISFLFSSPFHIITPNIHPYTDPDNSCLTISSFQSSVTHHNITLWLPPSLSTSANYTALLWAPSKTTHVNKPRPLTLPANQ